MSKRHTLTPDRIKPMTVVLAVVASAFFGVALALMAPLGPLFAYMIVG